MTRPIQDRDVRLIDMETGETFDVDILVSSKQPDRWDRVYPKQLARMLDMMGDERIKVISFLIRRKDHLNTIVATMREISDKTGVSLKTVSRVMKKMQEEDYIHKVRNGKWRFSPRIICNGDHRLAMATINYYDELDGKQ